MIRVPILMYHHVAATPLKGFQKYTVTTQAFAAQMSWLRLMHYTPITLDSLMAARQGAGALPPRPVLITFDDGFQECIEQAAPIMQHYRMSAIFYLVAGLVGHTSEWLKRERGVELELANWQTAQQLLANGFQCGGHSLTHPHLTELTDTACRRELLEARRLLEQNLGREITHLAYPFGAWNARVCALAIESGYRSACSVEIGLSTERDSLFGLRRIPISGFDSLADFVCRLSTGWRWGEWVRGRFELQSKQGAHEAKVA